MTDEGATRQPPARLLTEPWAGMWRDELNGSRAFALAAGRFSGRVAFLLRDTDADRMVALEIADGRCREFAAVVGRDAAGARFALEADAAVWHEILSGHDDAVAALRAGRLKLVRGTLFGLLPHLALARELLAAAGRVPTDFDRHQRA